MSIKDFDDTQSKHQQKKKLEEEKYEEPNLRFISLGNI
jgi:hypothetical protein